METHLKDQFTSLKKIGSCTYNIHQNSGIKLIFSAKVFLKVYLTLHESDLIILSIIQHYISFLYKIQLGAQLQLKNNNRTWGFGTKMYVTFK